MVQAIQHYTKLPDVYGFNTNYGFRSSYTPQERRTFANYFLDSAHRFIQNGHTIMNVEVNRKIDRASIEIEGPLSAFNVPTKQSFVQWAAEQINMDRGELSSLMSISPWRDEEPYQKAA